jgi:hypothetical protein
MVGFCSRFSRFGLALALLALVACPAMACPFCAMQGKTLTGEVKEASLVVYGTIKNAKADPMGDGIDGTADLVIEAVIKRPQKKEEDVLGDRKTLTINRNLTLTENYKFLVFCDVFKGKIDPYRGVSVKADSNMARYLEGALKLEASTAPVADKLRFFYDYLEDSEIEIATDAYKEFANAGAKDVQAMVARLKPDEVAKAATWLDKPGVSFKTGLYASLLGYSGDKKYATKLRDLLNDPDRRLGGGVDGMLASYIMLEPDAGWKFLRTVLADSSAEFPYRHSALRAARYFYDSPDHHITRDAVVSAALLLLPQADISDLAIEDLRAWERWEQADRVLALRDQWAWETLRVALHLSEENKTPFEVPIIRRAVLRYAIECQGKEKAKAFVAQERAANPMLVTDCEYLLKLEKQKP